MQESEKNQDIVFPFFKGLSFPFDEIGEHLKDFFLLNGFLSFISALFAFSWGRSFLCGTSLYEKIYCVNNGINFTIVVLFSFFAVGYFINRWRMIVDGEKDLYQAIKTRCFKSDLKTAFVAFFYLCLWIIIGGGCYLLNERVPADSKAMEMLFFVPVSLVILAAVFLLFYFVIFVPNKKEKLHLKQVFWPIFDNVYKLVLWFFIYLLIFVYFYQVVLSFFVKNEILGMFGTVFLSEFCFYFLLYSIAAVYLTMFNFQEKYLNPK